MCIYDYSGDYEAGRREDWKAFVKSVAELLELDCCTSVNGGFDLRKVAEHTGGDIDDCALAVYEIRGWI